MVEINSNKDSSVDFSIEYAPVGPPKEASREGKEGKKKLHPTLIQSQTPFKDRGEKQGTNLSRWQARSGEAEEEVVQPQSWASCDHHPRL